MIDLDNTTMYKYERLSTNNINDLAKLFASVYGHEPSPDFFRNKYNTAYTGATYIGFIAYNKECVPISYYGAIPTLLWVDGRVILAAQFADAMTHPKYRDSGLFIQLAKKTCELCKTEGIKIAFGFPNQNSYPGLLSKLHCYTNGGMDRFMLPVKKMIPFEKLARKYAFLKPWYIRYKSWVLKKYIKPQTGIVNSVLADNYNGVWRDDNYLRYKTYSNTQVIEIAGARLWIKLRNGLQVGDIAGITNNFDVIITALQNIARKLGIAEIHFHASGQTQLHDLFADKYKALPSFPVIFKDLGGDIPTGRIKFTLADIDIF
jgi:hypothetical protein